MKQAAIFMRWKIVAGRRQTLREVGAERRPPSPGPKRPSEPRPRPRRLLTSLLLREARSYARNRQSRKGSRADLDLSTSTALPAGLCFVGSSLLPAPRAVLRCVPVWYCSLIKISQLLLSFVGPPFRLSSILPQPTRSPHRVRRVVRTNGCVVHLRSRRHAAVDVCGRG